MSNFTAIYFCKLGQFRAAKKMFSIIKISNLQKRAKTFYKMVPNVALGFKFGNKFTSCESKLDHYRVLIKISYKMVQLTKIVR